jgi:hypothetical protein
MKASSDIQARFAKLISNTACPFAKGAQVFYAPSWDINAGMEQNLAAVVSSFIKFFESEKVTMYDLFVCEVREKVIVSSIVNIAGYLNKLLNEIHKTDHLAVTNISEGIEKMDWDFYYLNTPFFVAVFGPMYQKNHPRFSFSNDTAFVMFQPDSTFDRYNINSQSESRSTITSRVMTLFETQGFDYNVKLVSGSPKAIRFLKPIDLNDQPIEWWKSTIYM